MYKILLITILCCIIPCVAFAAPPWGEVTLNIDSLKPQISIIVGALTAIAFAVGSSMRW